jgi:hypothetical protein
MRIIYGGQENANDFHTVGFEFDLMNMVPCVYLYVHFICYLAVHPTSFHLFHSLHSLTL